MVYQAAAAALGLQTVSIDEMTGIQALERAAWSIRGPRIYHPESLPCGSGWSDVTRLLADTVTDKPRDIRDRAILMLLAIYGLRRGEVVSLRLDQID